MKCFGIVSVIMASACFVSAAPALPKRETNFGGVAGPLGGMLGGSGANGAGAGAQDATSEFFKLGDAFLNVPGDALSDPTSIISNMAKTLGSLPKDGMNAVTDTTGGGK
ncbi:hypothetical protein E4U58_005788 [Claviceps cyperi]|nr:hypothetical protein E4U58_005788 [Claviceps cyperi]